ncbi:MAG TPA: OmpA family protein [Polyangiaceae bacterium]|nr:OmpA family protein [Polyangiaceae bacterium]
MGCRKDNADKPHPVESGPNKQSIKQNYEGLKTQVSALGTKLTSLHKQLEELPQEIPAVSEMRAKLFAAEEVLGVTGAKLSWLAERVDANGSAGTVEDLRQLSKEISDTGKEIQEVDRVGLELTHQLLPFRKMLASGAKDAAGGPAFARRLSTGYEIQGRKDGLEQRLVEQIEDSKKKADQKSWFDLDRVVFHAGGADLDREQSKAQLQNLAEILKAYPSVKLRIGSHTDNSGAAAGNKKLSVERAQAVKKELFGFGVAAARLETEGFGAEHPVCPANDTEECRARNRRTAVVVIAK